MGLQAKFKERCNHLNVENGRFFISNFMWLNFQNLVARYNEMQKHYIGKSELEGLIRSGYVGTYSQDTDNIHEIIRLISSGQQNNGLVIAFKNRLSGE